MHDSSSIKVGIAWRNFLKEMSGHIPENELIAIANMIFEHFFHLNPAQRILQRQNELPHGADSLLQKIIQDLKDHVPVQHITGIANFCDLEFRVDNRVLIPRPETEELVEWVLARIADDKLQASPLRILDVCTGSGCIAISLGHRLKGKHQVAGCDISVEALTLAGDNAQRNNVTVQFFWCDALSENIPMHQVDIIVCNPPYVTPAEKLLMCPNVINHEPHLALFVPAHDPLIFYKAVATQATRILKPKGMIFFEINENFPYQTIEILQSCGFENCIAKEDFHGKPRFVHAQMPA